MKSQADTVAFSILGAFLLQEKVLNAHFIIWFSDFEWRATELSKFNKNDMKYKGRQWLFFTELYWFELIEISYNVIY